ncbi:MAG: HAD-IA family hydrolase [Deltaproteobacteria bacterium]|nr:HAD-IA family hydrolase [Deltaproteobacteria bacterium]
MSSRASSARPVTHVLFDLDGVLLDTEGLYTAATASVLARFGISFDPALKSRLMGRDALVSARIVIDALGVPLSPEDLVRERRPRLEALLAESPPREGAESFVRALRSAGAPAAVATSSERALYELKSGRHAWFDLFAAVVCGDDPRVRARKPAPDIFLVAAAALGAPPSGCLVVEDSPAGAEAAIAAGMRVVVLADPSLGPADFPPVDRLVRSFDDLDAKDLLSRGP